MCAGQFVCAHSSCPVYVSDQNALGSALKGVSGCEEDGARVVRGEQAADAAVTLGGENDPQKGL